MEIIIFPVIFDGQTPPDPAVSIGMYAAVLHALNNMDTDLLKIAKDDELGRKLQDLELLTPQRAPKRRTANNGRSR